MYWKHFGLADEPFSLLADSRFLFLTDAHREVLGALRESVEAERGFAALIGPPGVGKTTLLCELIEQLRETTVPVSIVQTNFELIDILRLLLKELGQDTTKVDAASLHLRFAEVLRHVAKKGKRFVLVIDEAQALNPAALETIRLLSNIELGRKKIVEAVFAGQHGFEELLARPSLQHLKQRIAAYGRLKPFTKEETRDYVMHRVRVAGGSKDLFTPEALDVLADLSHGVPRTINIYGFQVLHAAIKKNAKSVDAALTRQAIHEFEGWPLPGVAPIFERAVESRPAPPERAPEEDRFFLAAKDPGLEALLQNMRSERTQQRDRSAGESPGGAPRLEPPAPPNFAAPPADTEVLAFSIAAAIKTAEPMATVLRTGAATAPAMEDPVAPPKAEPLPAPPEPKTAAKAVVVAMPVKSSPVAETKAEPAVPVKQKTTTTVTMRPRVVRARRVRIIAAVALAVLSLAGGGAFAYKFGWFTMPETASAAAVNHPAAASVPVPESTPVHTSAAISQATEVMPVPVNSVVTRQEAPHRSAPTSTVAEIAAGKARRLSETDPAPIAPVSLGMTTQPSLASALNPNSQAVALRPRVSEAKPAVAIAQPKPVYPEMANRLRLTGEVVLRVQVNAQGKPAKVEVISGHPLLAAAAKNAVLSGWRFTPASVNGNNVESETEVRINFRGSR